MVDHLTGVLGGGVHGGAAGGQLTGHALTHSAIHDTGHILRDDRTEHFLAAGLVQNLAAAGLGALEAKAGRGLTLALLLFVGIPLPGTGAWTGTLAGSILDMKFKDVLVACMGGVLLAGIIMGLASAGLLGALSGLFAVG